MTRPTEWTTAAACQAGAHGALEDIAGIAGDLATLVHLDPEVYTSAVDRCLDVLRDAYDQASRPGRRAGSEAPLPRTRAQIGHLTVIITDGDAAPTHASPDHTLAGDITINLDRDQVTLTAHCPAPGCDTRITGTFRPANSPVVAILDALRRDHDTREETDQ